MTPPIDLGRLSLPYALVGLILLAETQTLFRRRAASQKRDAGSFGLVIVLSSAGYWAAFATAALAPGRFLLPGWWRWLGAAWTIGGACFRLWAVRTLGSYFTRTVQVCAGQSVVETGPYRLLRHPSYTGAIAAATGVGLALGNWLSLGLAVVPLLAGLLYRIKVEEKALAVAIGQPYRDYCSRTKRLVPFVY